MEARLLFAAKFGELEAQYARLEQRFTLCRAGDRESIRQECGLLADECMAWENTLSAQANSGRSKAVEALSLARPAPGSPQRNGRQRRRGSGALC